MGMNAVGRVSLMKGNVEGSEWFEGFGLTTPSNLINRLANKTGTSQILCKAQARLGNCNMHFGLNLDLLVQLPV